MRSRSCAEDTLTLFRLPLQIAFCSFNQQSSGLGTSHTSIKNLKLLVQRNAGTDLLLLPAVEVFLGWFRVGVEPLAAAGQPADCGSGLSDHSGRFDPEAAAPARPASTESGVNPAQVRAGISVGTKILLDG